MWRLMLFIVASSLRYAEGLDYDSIARDECLKKAYICEDHRTSITGGTGVYVTEQSKFRDICRRHKEFIACINDAAKFCEKSQNVTAIAQMTLDNRKSLKMFCREAEWKKNYFSSVGCINQQEDAIMDECREEEAERSLNRPRWCFIPEPCEGIERVFNCSVEKMKKKCGLIGAEVYRRLHRLKVEKLDVVCAFRLRQPTYCATKYPGARPRRETGELSRSLKKSTSHEMGETLNIIIEATETAIDSLIKALREQALILKSRMSELLKELKEHKIDNDPLLTSTTYPQSSQVMDFIKANKQINKEFSSSNQLPNELKDIENNIIVLYKSIVSGNADINHADKQVEVTWHNLNDFNLNSLTCSWGTDEVFKCVIRSESSLEQTPEVLDSYRQIKEKDLSRKLSSESLDNGSKYGEKNEFKENSDTDRIRSSLNVEHSNFADVRRSGDFFMNPSLDGYESESNTNLNEDKSDTERSSEMNYVLLGNPYFVDYSKFYIEMKKAITDKSVITSTVEPYLDDWNELDNKEPPRVAKENELNILRQLSDKKIKDEIKFMALENILNESFQHVEVTEELNEKDIENSCKKQNSEKYNNGKCRNPGKLDLDTKSDTNTHNEL